MGKKVAVVAVFVIGLIVVLTAVVGHGHSSSKTVAPAAAATSDPSTPAAAVRAVLIEKGYPELASAADQTYDQVGRNICDVVKQMSPLDESDVQALAYLVASTLSKATGRQYTLEDGATIAGIFVGAYCPSEATVQG